MPAVTLAICGNELAISARAPHLIRLFADYFRYFAPSISPSALTPNSSANHPPTLEITLNMRDELPPRERLIPSSAELYSQTDIVSLWREAGTERPRDGVTERGSDDAPERGTDGATAQRDSAIRNPQSAMGSAGERFYFHLGVAAFRVDVDVGRAVGLVTPQAMEYPHILANTYALFALLLLLRSRALYHLHAAAIVSPSDELWLICGAQRAGKTTLTTALGLSGWRPVSDDSLLVGGDDAGAWLTPLKKYFHLGDELLHRWPQLQGIQRYHQYLDRTCVGGLEFFGTRELAETKFRRIDRIVLPQIVNEPVSRVDPLPRSAALLRLAEQSMFFQLWRDHTAQQWRWLNDLAANANCLCLFSAADLLANPAAAAQTLTGLTQNPGARTFRPL